MPPPTQPRSRKTAKYLQQPAPAGSGTDAPIMDLVLDDPPEVLSIESGPAPESIPVSDQLMGLTARVEAIDKASLDHQLETLDLMTFFGERLDEMEQRIKKLNSTIKDLNDVIDNQRSTINQQNAFISDMETELKKHSDYLSKMWKFRKNREELKTFAKKGLDRA